MKDSNLPQKKSTPSVKTITVIFVRWFPIGIIAFLVLSQHFSSWLIF